MQYVVPISTCIKIQIVFENPFEFIYWNFKFQRLPVVMEVS